mmetsp:Transcript_14103/g.49657  ORF Transcript_14103/g.49657 Transcript_14103/m.49657 type:complete len:235 (-) Transcript_14103:3648-4352(-)
MGLAEGDRKQRLCLVGGCCLDRGRDVHGGNGGRIGPSPWLSPGGVRGGRAGSLAGAHRHVGAHDQDHRARLRCAHGLPAGFCSGDAARRLLHEPLCCRPSFDRLREGAVSAGRVRGHGQPLAGPTQRRRRRRRRRGAARWGRGRGPEAQRCAAPQRRHHRGLGLLAQDHGLHGRGTIGSSCSSGHVSHEIEIGWIVGRVIRHSRAPRHVVRADVQCNKLAEVPDESGCSLGPAL